MTDAIAAASVVALVVDSYERFGVVDGWLRNRLLPSLPARTTTVLVGRNPPNVAWRTAPGWRQLLVDVLLGPLTEAGAAELVARKGLAGDARPSVRGGSAVVTRSPWSWRRGAHPPPRAGDGRRSAGRGRRRAGRGAVRRSRSGVRGVVEAASVLRRVTVPALAAVLERDEAAAELAWSRCATCRSRPFVADGVELQASCRT